MLCVLQMRDALRVTDARCSACAVRVTPSLPGRRQSCHCKAIYCRPAWQGLISSLPGAVKHMAKQHGQPPLAVKGLSAVLEGLRRPGVTAPRGRSSILFQCLLL
ncbi:hypothetical protein FKM82_017186 [Ascaphus truei]